ncbi:hypothetical protein E1B25_20935 [Antarcticimicrobium sediminis]|uniref:Uncharacterized protein n=1 Tax=Antarcticimicrobium sediminis TaxID=2546227 RepID=A0A4R5EH63_9RHOB|nr:hypothetical protein E1B25_20935 [Antarcticimicrobium sediminis]
MIQSQDCIPIDSCEYRPDTRLHLITCSKASEKLLALIGASTHGFNNPRRRHSALGWKSLVTFERQVA